MANDGGYFAVPRELWREARRALSPSHRLVLVALIAEANYTPGEVATAEGHRIALDVGEVLVGSRTFAARQGLGRWTVLRALRGLADLGWITVRPALESAPPPAPPPAQRPHRPPAPPPTVVRLNVYREVVWPGPDTAPPPGSTPRTTPRTAAAPIQQGSIQQELPCAPDGAPPPSRAQDAGSPPAARPSSKHKGDPRHQFLVEGLVADFLAARGVAYGFAGTKDAAAVKALLALGTAAVGSEGAVDEVRRRWKIALGFGARWPGCSSIAMLPARWNEVATAPPKLGPDGRPLKRYPKITVPTEWS